MISVVKSLKIGPMNYSVKMVEGLEFTNSDGEVVGLLGLIEFGKEQILLESRATDRVIVSTLMHEAVHAMLSQGGLLNHEEEIAQNLGYALYAFIRDNPAFVKQIQKKE